MSSLEQQQYKGNLESKIDQTVYFYASMDQLEISEKKRLANGASTSSTSSRMSQSVVFSLDLKIHLSLDQSA